MWIRIAEQGIRFKLFPSGILAAEGTPERTNFDLTMCWLTHLIAKYGKRVVNVDFVVNLGVTAPLWTETREYRQSHPGMYVATHAFPTIPAHHARFFQ